MNENKIDVSLLGHLKSEKIASAVVFVKDKKALNQLEEKCNVVARFPFINAVGISESYLRVCALARLPYVEYINSQSKVTMLAKNYQVEVPHKVQRQSMLTGKGVTLCVMDTGISPHLDLCMPKFRIKEFYDIVNEQSDAYDDNGHGTFVAGVACGNGLSSGGGVLGVAPNADVVGLKVIEKSGECGAFNILNGMQWVLDNHERLNIKVVCMSFGSDPLPENDPLKMGVEVLVKNGITVVCAAGNSGENGLKSPGISQDVITVGSVDNYNLKADFSSFGTYKGLNKPDVYAKGVSITGLSFDGCYMKMSGTSVSAPYIAGACCLLLERYPNLSPFEIKRLLVNSCQREGGLNILNLD